MILYYSDFINEQTIGIDGDVFNDHEDPKSMLMHYINNALNTFMFYNAVGKETFSKSIDMESLKEKLGWMYYAANKYCTKNKNVLIGLIGILKRKFYKGEDLEDTIENISLLIKM